MTGPTGAGSVAGLTLINETSFSAVSSVTVDTVFSPAYTNYRIVISGLSASASFVLRLQLRAAGVTSATGYYFGGHRTNQAAASAALGGAGAVAWNVLESGSAFASGTVSVDLSSPAVAIETSFTSLSGYSNSAITALSGYLGGVHQTAAAYDGFILSGGSGTISGIVRVYAYQNTPGGGGAGTVVEEWDFETTGDGSAISAIADLFGATTAITTLANTRYEFEVEAWYVRDANAGTVTFTLTNSQTYTRFNAMLWHSPAAGMAANATSLNTSGVEGVTTAAAALPATASQTASTAHQALIKGTFTTNAAGTWRIRAATSLGSIILQAGSKFKVRRFASGNVGSFVA